MSIDTCDDCCKAIDTDYQDPYIEHKDNKTDCLCTNCLSDRIQAHKQK